MVTTLKCALDRRKVCIIEAISMSSGFTTTNGGLAAQLPHERNRLSAVQSRDSAAASFSEYLTQPEEEPHIPVHDQHCWRRP
jgi:hypothetical protein